MTKIDNLRWRRCKSLSKGLQIDSTDGSDKSARGICMELRYVGTGSRSAHSIPDISIKTLVTCHKSFQRLVTYSDRRLLDIISVFSEASNIIWHRSERILSQTNVWLVIQLKTVVTVSQQFPPTLIRACRRLSDKSRTIPERTDDSRRHILDFRSAMTSSPTSQSSFRPKTVVTCHKSL